MGWTIDTFLPVSQSFFHPVMWANFGLIGRWVAQAMEPGRLPILILSMPRSGSSWVGKMLGSAQEALYLREPINQSMLEHTDLPTLFEVSSRDIASNVRPLAEDVFAGYPAFDRGIVKQVDQWSLTRRKEKQVIIKEVNPFFYPWLSESFDFKTIYLVRHPGAVASSFNRLGWRSGLLRCLPAVREQIEERHHESFWAKHGAAQAIASRTVMDALREQDQRRYQVVRYEDLCRRPEGAFRELFGSVGLNWSEQDRERVERHTTATNARREKTYDTRRKSSEMVGAWRDDISKDQLRDLKEAYLHYNPPLYAEGWEA